MRARQRIADGRFDGLGYEHGLGIYNLYLLATGSTQSADKARSKYNAAKVEQDCERANAARE